MPLMSDVETTLSIWSLIGSATVAVKIVMLILIAASVVSWVMIFKSGFYQRKAKSAFDYFEKQFWSGVDLNQLFRQGNGHDRIEGIENIFRAGFKEFTRLRQQAGADSDAIMEGAQRAMRVALAREEEKLDENLPFLASVASVSPYIGLFGTVWGIMNSFMNLSNVHQTTLATVAPGIAEALIATAMGLFAAIPAVLAYNKFAGDVNKLAIRFDSFMEEFSNILQRQIRA